MMRLLVELDEDLDLFIQFIDSGLIECQLLMKLSNGMVEGLGLGL